MKRLLLTVTAAAALAPLAAAASPLPLSLQVAAQNAYPGAQIQRLCQKSFRTTPPPDLYGYALMSSGGKNHAAAFQFINTAGWFLMAKDGVLTPQVEAKALGKVSTAKVTAFCERKLPTSHARMCSWRFDSSNVVGSWSRAQNLRIGGPDRVNLHTAYAACHTTDDAGPAPGSVFYARYGGYEWAAATFAALGDQPETFVRPLGQPDWSDQGDTGGELCENRIPGAVLKLWGFTKETTVNGKPGSRCFIHA